MSSPALRRQLGDFVSSSRSVSRGERGLFWLVAFWGVVGRVGWVPERGCAFAQAESNTSPPQQCAKTDRLYVIYYKDYAFDGVLSNAMEISPQISSQCVEVMPIGKVLQINHYDAAFEKVRWELRACLDNEPNKKSSRCDCYGKFLATKKKSKSDIWQGVLTIVENTGVASFVIDSINNQGQCILSTDSSGVTMELSKYYDTKNDNVTDSEPLAVYPSLASKIRGAVAELKNPGFATTELLDRQLKLRKMVKNLRITSYIAVGLELLAATSLLIAGSRVSPGLDCDVNGASTSLEEAGCVIKENDVLKLKIEDKYRTGLLASGGALLAIGIGFGIGLVSYHATSGSP